MRARQASPKVLAIAGGVIVLVVVAIVLAVVLSSKGGSSTGTNYDGSGDGPTITIASSTPKVGSSTSATALPGAADAAKLFKDIPQKGFVLGKADAPVTLVEYLDFQCPNCQNFETTELPTLVNNYVRQGKLKIKMQPWSILDRTSDQHDSDRGQNATIAAAAQNRAFNFAEVLYYNQPPNSEGTGWMNDAMISNIAASVDGLDPYKLATDAKSSATQRVVKSVADFASAHFNQATGEMAGTPNLYLGRGNGSPHFYTSGVPDLPSLEAAINALLPKKK